MNKCYKLRIYPNKTQIDIINGTLGCCNWVKNQYLEMNIKLRKENKTFMTGYDFSKYINNLKKNNPDYQWIKQYSSKAIKDAIMTKEKAYKRFFKTKHGFPKFKSRKKLNKESYFFVKNNVKYIKKNIIKLPILGKVRITENSYLPDLDKISSGRIVREYNKYYAVFIIKTEKEYIPLTNEKLGIDVGIKHYATIATTNDNYYVTHFKDYKKYKSYEERIINLQRIISNKVEINYTRLLNNWMDNHPNQKLSDKLKNIMKGESYNSSRIRGLRRKTTNIRRKQRNIRNDFINKLIYSLTARTKPLMITIENLDISEMIKHDGTKNTQLHKYIQESSFYTFKQKLTDKCSYHGIILRMANKYFASSKICCECGNKKKNLTLNDRVYKCDHCGNEIDRDLNAAINLLYLSDSKITILNA